MAYVSYAIFVMHVVKINALDVRKKFGELLELAYYKGNLYQIARKHRAMAWIVGQPFMVAVSRAIEYAVENDPTLADSLALSLDDDIRDVIEQGSREVKEGKTAPLETILDE